MMIDDEVSGRCRPRWRAAADLPDTPQGGARMRWLQLRSIILGI